MVAVDSKVAAIWGWGGLFVLIFWLCNGEGSFLGLTLTTRRFFCCERDMHVLNRKRAAK